MFLSLKKMRAVLLQYMYGEGLRKRYVEDAEIAYCLHRS